MAALRQFSDDELLLLTTPDDTEEAPWMVMPDFQWRVVSLLMSILGLYVRRTGQRWYLGAELKVTMPRPAGQRALDLGPDMMMAEADDAVRDSWNVRVEGEPPLFVLEVVTDESRARDMDEKPILYDQMGVREYAIFAPRRRDNGPVLFGYHRDVTGRFMSWAPDATGVLRVTSLGGLGLYVEGDRLRVRDAQGRRLPSAEEEAARAEEEAARAEEEAARAEEEAARAAQEVLARQDAERRAAAAEAEVTRLRALLARDGA